MKVFPKTRQRVTQWFDQIDRDEAIAAEQRELIDTGAIPIVHFATSDAALD